jgi:outer membrane protein insertion porin family
MLGWCREITVTESIDERQVFWPIRSDVRVVLRIKAVLAAKWALSVVLFLTLQAEAKAVPWSVEPGLLSSQAIISLKLRYPDISSPDHLSNLLLEIGRRYPLHELKATYVDGKYRIIGQKANLIIDIQIDLVGRFLRTPVRQVVQKYISQVDAPEIRTKLKADIARYLIDRGYHKHQITMTILRSEKGAIYEYEIDAGNPCIVADVKTKFKLPKGFSLEIDEGAICDREEINNAIATLERELRENGYNQFKIDLLAINFNLQTNQGTVEIDGFIDRKIKYEIVDVSKKFLIDELFTPEELTNIDPIIVGPDAMASELERRYKNLGYPDVLVEGPEIKSDTIEEITYLYKIKPGIQYSIESIQFEGATVFSREEMLEITGTTGFWQAAQPLNLERIREGLDGLRAKYQAFGYWNAKVHEPRAIQKNRISGTVKLVVKIKEGLPRILQKVTIQGNKAINESEIYDLLAAKTGTALNRSHLVDFNQALRARYVGMGFRYIDVKIKVNAIKTKKTIPTEIVVDISEGTRVRVRDINIKGLVRTSSEVVERELRFKRGDWYSPEKITDSRKALVSLGLFRSVQISQYDPESAAEQQSEIDLLVDVREGKPGNVSFGPGWSYYTGMRYGADASYNNIGGLGRQVSIRSLVSEEKHQEAIGPKTLLGRTLGIGYKEPYVLDLPIDAKISLTHKALAKTSFWEMRYGGELAFTHTLERWIQGSRITAYYSQEISKSEGSREKEKDLVASDARIGSVGLRYDLDNRDNIKFPTEGYFIELGGQWARYKLVGDVRFFKWNFGISNYFEVFTNFVLALGINLTAYENVQRKGQSLGILPASERLNSGGAETVRGFRPRTLGPVVRSPVFIESVEQNGSYWNCDYVSTVLGGTHRTTIKTELRMKVDDNLATSVFVDSGNVFFSKDQMNKFQVAYLEPTDRGPQNQDSLDKCGNETIVRSVEDNIGYQYRDLVTKPGYLWSRHYQSYGVALSYLTVLGSINFAYGLPWHEPTTERCRKDRECFSRGKSSGYWLLRGEVHINVGAKF